MLSNFLILISSLFLVIKGAIFATKYSGRLADNFQMSKYIIGFVIVAFISIIPETFISINAALEGLPEFGLGTLFGSNVADLTLIFAILIISAGRGVKIESNILKNVRMFPFFLSLPILFGLNGYYTRLEGVILIFVGVIFYYIIFRNSKQDSSVSEIKTNNDKGKNILMLFLVMGLLLVGSHYTVTSAHALAHALGVSPVLIAMLVVSLGTTMPELFYSLKSVKNGDDSLAMGDILGSVLADATIVVGILATIKPFSFSVNIIYITGIFMVISSVLLLSFMISGKKISKKEGFILLFFWFGYTIVEFFLNK